MNRLNLTLPGTRIPGVQPTRTRTIAFKTRPDRQCVQVNAFFKFGEKQASEEEEMFTGFRYDPSMQRWIRAPNAKPTKDMFTVTPLSGSAYTVWPVMHQYLTKKKLKSVNQDEALSLVKKGAVLLDVRLGIDFESEHAAGAINVPLFRLTAGDGTWDKVKRVVMAGLNMRPTVHPILESFGAERDPDFVKNVESTIGRRKKLIVMCSVGGTLDTVVRVASTGKKTETDKDRAFGRESRSLKACYELLKAGFNDVVHLEGGLAEWRYNGYPMSD